MDLTFVRVSDKLPKLPSHARAEVAYMNFSVTPDPLFAASPVSGRPTRFATSQASTKQQHTILSDSIHTLPQHFRPPPPTNTTTIPFPPPHSKYAIPSMALLPASTIRSGWTKPHTSLFEMSVSERRVERRRQCGSSGGCAVPARVGPRSWSSWWRWSRRRSGSCRCGCGGSC